jgi:hypothetical protein
MTKRAKRIVEVRRPVSRPKRRVIEIDRVVERPMSVVSSEDLSKLIDAAAANRLVKKPPRFTHIKDHTSQQLDDAVNNAVAKFPDFYTLLHGIDAYMERRRRKELGGVLIGWNFGDE